MKIKEVLAQQDYYRFAVIDGKDAIEIPLNKTHIFIDSWDLPEDAEELLELLDDVARKQLVARIQQHYDHMLDMRDIKSWSKDPQVLEEQLDFLTHLNKLVSGHCCNDTCDRKKKHIEWCKKLEEKYAKKSSHS